ncbi:MAG: response regulator, partial [Lewinellaceae bacterium]|nr:response regulator [Lewinellaceae bacterium]
MARTLRIFWLLLFCSGLYAQPVRFDQLNVEHGLSQNTVNCIIKDSRGYLWIGTNDGLNRYDGYQFAVFRHLKQDSSSLSDNKVYALLEDRAGRLWVGTKNGLNRYDRNKGCFMRFGGLHGRPAGLKDHFIRSIYEDESGRIWVGTLKGGLSLWQPDEKKFASISPPPGQGLPAFEDVSSILECRNGEFWVATDAPGLYRLNRNNFAWEFFPFKSSEEAGKTAKKLFEDQMGNLWVATQGNGAFRLDQGRRRLSHFTAAPGSLPHSIVKDITEDEAGRIWLATDGGGITIYNPQKEEFSYIKYHPGSAHSLASNSVYTFFKDQEGILWVGTFDGGICVHNRNNKKFHHTGMGPEKENGLSHRSVLCFLEDHEQGVWVGTDGGGLNYFNPRKQTVEYCLQKEENGLSSNVVAALYEDRRHRIWIGTYTGGLQRLEKGRGITATYKHIPEDPHSICNNNVWALLEDGAGRFWVGTLGGLELFNPESGHFTHIRTQGLASDDPYLERVTELYESREGRIWVGGKGVRYFDPVSGALKFLEGEAGQAIRPFDSRAFFEDSHHNIWIGTEGGGLFLLGADGRQFRNYTVSDGLPSNTVHTVFEDNKGFLWMSTNEGLSRADPAKLLVANIGGGKNHFRNYCKKDGLQSNQFSYSAGLKAHSGELYFGGINGFNHFLPEEIKDNPYKPAIEITGLKVFDQYVTAGEEGSPLERPISELSELTLNHQQSQVFSLEFTALNFTSSEKNQYAYKLEGFMDEWSYIGTRRTATFTNLNPGTYTFLVKAANNDGVWNEEGKALKLKILPPFWKTNWAYAAYIVFSLLMLLGFRHAFLMRERMKNDLRIKDLEREKMEEVNRLKLAFFTNISHEFRTPLTLITAPVENLISREDIAPDARQQLGLVQRNTQRLLRLINELLEFRKIDDNKMELEVERRDVVSFIRGLKKAFDGLAASKQIHYSFESAFDKIYAEFDPDKLEKVIYNLLSNAFKFTKDEVRLSLRRGGRDGQYQIIVQDNGIGIAPEHQPHVFDRFYQVISEGSYSRPTRPGGTGIGLAYSRALVELHGGAIELDSEEGKGSCFTVVLPVRQPSGPLDTTDFVGNDPEPGYDFIIPEEDQTAGLVSSVPPISPAGSKEKPVLLIVEDNSDVRSFIRMSFQGYFQVLEAEDGEEGCSQALRHLPDIIISDIMMPRKDGVALCQELKNDDRTSHIPIILLTANTNEERWIHGLETGADDYVTKPFKFRFLKARIFNLLNSRKQLKRYFSRSVLQPEAVDIPSADGVFMKKAIALIEQHIGDAEFGVEQFAQELGMSRSVLYRKFSALTDQSVKEFINMIRLKRAAQLLASEADISVAEVAYSVGFSDSQYFSKKFKKYYHLTPTQFMEKKR